MKLLILEPYMSASHRQWLHLLVNYLPYDIKSLHLPGRHWKWRMHAAAVSFATQFETLDWNPDVILLSEMMDVALFKALIVKTGRNVPPICVYFHENQLSYPTSTNDHDQKLGRDNHYAFINYTSSLVADQVLFNSYFHQSDFLDHLPKFLANFPDQKHSAPLEQIFAKSTVIQPGVDLQYIDDCRVQAQNKVPLLLWNHRWEFDKNPNLFFKILLQLAGEGIDFGIVILGQAQAQAPKVFKEVRHRLAQRIVKYGYVSDKASYYNWLSKADIVISTSNQDFFGISVVEAIYSGCYPVLPNRLAFPEHITGIMRPSCLYNNEKELYSKVKALIEQWPHAKKMMGNKLRDHLKKYDINAIVQRYEKLFESMKLD